jgi:DNA-directed RNA polymerase subunit omega
MARITVEDCLQIEDNRFALVRLASVRTKQIRRGSESLTKEGRSNKPVVAALREIASGQVRFLTAQEEVEYREKLEEEQRDRQQQAEAASLMNTTVIPFQSTSRTARPSEDEGGEEALPQLFGDNESSSSLDSDSLSLDGKGVVAEGEEAGNDDTTEGDLDE